MLSNTSILVKSVEINIFHVNNRRGVLCLSHGRRRGNPAWRRQRTITRPLSRDVTGRHRCTQRFSGGGGGGGGGGALQYRTSRRNLSLNHWPLGDFRYYLNLNKCWPRPVSAYGVTRPQYDNTDLSKTHWFTTYILFTLSFWNFARSI